MGPQNSQTNWRHPEISISKISVGISHSQNNFARDESLNSTKDCDFFWWQEANQCQLFRK